MAVLSYLLPVVSCLLLGKVQSVSAVSALTRGALPCDSTVWMPGEALPLLSLLFPTFLIFQPSIFPVCQKDQEHLYPWVDTEINACRATQRHSWSAAFEAISCAWGWWSTLRCQSLPKEQEVPRESSSRADLGCFKAHVLAHSSTKSTLIYDLQLLIHLSAPCSETLLSQKMLVLLVTQRVDAASYQLCQHQSLWPGSCLQR